MSAAIGFSPFQHAESGMSRFPPNVEQITVERDALRVWINVRRNETIIRLPLDSEDVAHLVRLLTCGASPKCASPFVSGYAA